MTPFYSVGEKNLWLDVASSGGGTVDLGKILQVVSSFKNDYASTSAYLTKTETGLECAITPSNASNKIFITTTLSIGTDDNDTAYIYCDRDGSLIGGGTGGTTAVATAFYPYTNSAVYAGTVSWSYLDSPSTTSEVTYKILYNAITSSQTIFLNRRGFDTAWAASSSLTVFEVDGT